MTGDAASASRVRLPWPPFVLGGYAALAAVLPFPASAVAGALPLGAAGCWWLLRESHRWLAVFLCAAILLPPLPVALGDSGPHVSVLVACAGVLAGLVQQRRWRAGAGAPARALLSLWLSMLLSLCAAALFSGPALALASLARAMLFAISVYVFFYLTCGPGRETLAGSFGLARLLFLAAAAAAVAACVDFYFQFPAPAGFGPQFVWLDSGVYRRAQGFFYEASTLGNFCAFFLLMAVVALMRGKKESPLGRGAALLGIVAFGAALVLSYSRASIVNVGVALAALVLLRRRKAFSATMVFALAGVLAALAAAVYFVLPEFARLYWERLSASFVYFFHAADGILSGRLASWGMLLDFLARHPWHAVIGVGYKTLPYSDFIGRAVVGDNAYLTVLVEMGILGLAALVWLHAAILRAGYRAARSRDTRASFFGTWIFCFWCGQTVQMLSGDLLTYWRVLPLYFWALAMAVAASDERPAA
jgi:hypothetical protein